MGLPFSKERCEDNNSKQIGLVYFLNKKEQFVIYNLTIMTISTVRQNTFK